MAGRQADFASDSSHLRYGTRRHDATASRAQRATTLVGFAVVFLTTLAAISALKAQAPAVAVAIVLSLPLAYAMLTWPETAIVVVIFVLYSNAAVVAVRFHGVPHILGLIGPPLPLAVLLVCQLVAGGQKVILTPALPFIVAYFLIQLVGSLFAQYPEVSIDSVTVFAIEGIGLYLVVTNLIRSPQMITRVIWALLFAGALLGGLSTFQQITGTHDNNYGGFAQIPEGSKGFGVDTPTGKVRQKRACGSIGEKNRYAQIMLMLVPLGLFRLWSERPGPKKALAGIATALSAAGCALTFSRGAAVGFMMLLFIMTVLRYIKFRQLAVVLLGATLLLLAFPQLAARLSSVQRLMGLVVPSQSSPSRPLDGAVTGRATSMLSAARVAADHPLFGVGPGNFKYINHEYGKVGGFRAQEGNRSAHCLYLEIAAETGVPGLLCFFAIVFVTIRELVRARRRWLEERPDMANLATGFILAIVAYLTTGIFLHLSYARYFWLMLALASSAAYVANELHPTTDTAERDGPRKLHGSIA